VKVVERRRSIYLAIYDPRTLVKIKTFLEELGLKPKGIEFNARKIVGIVLCDDRGLEYLKNMGIEIEGYAIDVDNEPRCAALRALALSLNVDPDDGVAIVGVDLGERIGVAVILNGKLVVAKSFRNAELALELLSLVARCYGCKKIVRIGIPRKEDPSYEKFIDRVVALLSDSIELELVPEVGTSTMGTLIEVPEKLDRDSLAAINIALARSRG